MQQVECGVYRQRLHLLSRSLNIYRTVGLLWRERSPQYCTLQKSTSSAAAIIMEADKISITHILTSPEHTLELVPAGDNGEFVCYNCGEAGTGIHYRCKNCDDLRLHQGCAAGPVIIHALSIVPSKKGFECKQCSKVGTSRSADCGDFFVHGGCTVKEQEEEKTKLEEIRALLEKQKLEETTDTGDGEARSSLCIDLRKYVNVAAPRIKFNLCPVAASSTNNDNASIGNTLEPDESEWVNFVRNSKEEWLLYALPSSRGNIVDEIQVDGYSVTAMPWEVRIKIGTAKSFDQSPYSPYSDDNYDWIYTSEVIFELNFDGRNHKVMRSFKLPSPVRCIGGFLKIELSCRYARTFCVVREVVLLGRQIPIRL